MPFHCVPASGHGGEGRAADSETIHARPQGLGTAERSRTWRVHYTLKLPGEAVQRLAASDRASCLPSGHGHACVDVQHRVWG